MRIVLSLTLTLVCLGVACDGSDHASPEAGNAVPSELQLAAAGSASEVGTARGGQSRCSRNNGGCEQICREVGRAVACECEPGGYLKPDRRSCWSWHTPTAVESFNTADATEPRVATDPQGRATAVWTQGGTTSTVWSARTSGPAAGWGASVQLDGGATYGARTPQVAVDGGGNAVALWQRAIGNFGFSANLFRSSTWSAPELLVDDFSGAATRGPVLSGSRDGAALAVWGTSSGRGPFLGAFTLSGTTWTRSSLPIAAPATSVPSVNFVQGASGPNGEGAMLWFQTDGTTAGLFLNQFRNGQWGSAAIPVDVAGSGGGSQGQLAIVRGPAELVTWIAGSAVWANLLTAWGWTGAVSIRSATGNVVSDVRLVSDARGEAAIAIWLEQGSTRTSVWTSRFSGGTWSAAVNIETSPSGNAGSPRIALEPSGIAVAVWTQVATRVDVWANRFAPGMGWGTAARIESDDAGDAAAPSVAVDSRGNARAVWQQSDGTRVNVLSNYFE